MNKVFFSSVNCAFYLTDYKQRYESGSGWPEDATEISAEQWDVFAGSAPEGKILGSDSAGMPAWVDLPAPTQQEIEASALAQKAGLVTAANDFINENMWPSKLMLGRLTEDEKARFNRWLDYVDAVQSVNVLSPDKTEWPQSPE